MKPERTQIINNQTIEQFYWNGDMLIYVNNRLLVGETYEDACEKLSKGIAIVKDKWGEQRFI